MKTLLFPLLVLSLTLTAQEKGKIRPLLKKDTLKIHNKEQLDGKLGLKLDQQQKDLYKIVTVRPKDSIIYMALKEPEKDYSKYKILNPVTPEKLKLKTDKAATPPK